MPRRGRLFLPLDCGYFDDDAVVELSDLAQLLDLRAMVLSKRLGTEGRLTGRQLCRIAPRSVPESVPMTPDGTPIVDELVHSSLWTADDNFYVRRSWPAWHDSAAAQHGGAKGNHLRWHANRGIVDPNCSLCIGTESPTDSGRSSLPIGTPNPRVEQSREELTPPTPRRAGGLRGTGTSPREVRALADMQAAYAADAARIEADIAGFPAYCRNHDITDEHEATAAAGRLFADPDHQQRAVEGWRSLVTTGGIHG